MLDLGVEQRPSLLVALGFQHLDLLFPGKLFFKFRRGIDLMRIQIDLCINQRRSEFLDV